VITKFPSPQRQLKPLKVELSLHEGVGADVQDDNREWVRWIFQSIRARCQGMVFQSTAGDRSVLIEDWKKFVEQFWMTVLAPALLEAWQEAVRGDQAALLKRNNALSQQLPVAASVRSLEAGAILLKQTSGARYQGVLGRFRQIHLDEGADVHAVSVWSCIAVLFQLPLTDVLTEYLREEWLAGSQSCHHRDEPQGQLSFGALTHRAMREGGMLDFEIKVETN
jgi:hypothetical protein